MTDHDAFSAFPMAGIDCLLGIMDLFSKGSFPCFYFAHHIGFLLHRLLSLDPAPCYGFAHLQPCFASCFFSHSLVMPDEQLHDMLVR